MPGQEQQANQDSNVSKPPAYCAVVGPSGAGKTNFILALVQACCLPGSDGWQLRLRHTDQSEELYRSAAAFRPDAPVLPRATTGIVRYEFEVDVSMKQSWWQSGMHSYSRLKPSWMPDVPVTPSEMSVRFRIVDGPGGHLFSAGDLDNVSKQGREELVLEAAIAQSLILCVNAADPQLDTLQAELPLLLSKLCDSDGSLRFPRVLLLLTQVDRVAERFLKAVRRCRANSNGSATLAARYFSDHPDATALRICERIDPLSLARDLLDERILHNLWVATGPGNKLGIGVCSAWGFDADTGSPFADEEPGTPKSRRDWRPFGIREALYFLLNNEYARDRFLGPISEFVKDGRPSLPIFPGFEIPIQETP